ncbi:RNA polymerase sigma factor [Labilibaculum sp. DW002]|uniref:RNA polymerase sigma factor n=1 Tax=Paralabilibaculum antarcticum TaxID=2912572 RepID=A0ABT5VWQ3_9BACT|nr:MULTISPECIES: RNA polymerase sigma factor [unclassified Labilibaculum]MBI9056684.1 RNA polymerase sigma factor [Labilibaculum sp.]MDE5419860.1 RNA polymerase sigma factor [Labilibaculum sp. DW002]
MNLNEYNIAVDQHADGMFRFILKNIRDEDKARDIVQDSFEKLWRNVDGVNFLKVKSYLYTTAYHTMIDLIRREKRKEDFENVDVGKYAHSEQYTDLSEVLDEALKRLSDVQRSVILLRDYEGYSYAEIAKITNLSESQVKVYIYRARKSLKEYIGSIESIV